MNFASLQFWFILALCFSLSRVVLLVTRKWASDYDEKASKLCLFATAIVLLASESWLSLIAFFWVVSFGWIAISVERLSSRFSSFCFFILLLAQLAPLIYFKYWDFIFNQVFQLDWRVPSVLIPMGLSFYTFQTISFWVDTQRCKEKVPASLDFLNFCSFFPQIVAGPIERREDLLPQISRTRFNLDFTALDESVRWIVLGLGYKLIVADNLGNLSPLLQIQANNAFHVWFECLVFGLRIYFDFAGYSFIAVGLGLLFGVRLTLNFVSPYWSKNLREFWRRWHVSLGSWLRDYVYMPLGGRGRRWIINTLIVFVVSGLWHGAGWGFLIWGLLHGAGIVICGFGGSVLLPDWFKRLITFTYAIGIWLFFFEQNTGLMLTKALTLVNPVAYLPEMAFSLPAVFQSPSDAVTFALILGLALSALMVEGLDFRQKEEAPRPYRFLRTTPAILMIVFITVWLAPTEESSFIYFNF